MDKIRLGILGPGRIVERVMTDMHNAKEIELVAIASRSLDKAQVAAQKFGAKIAYGSYEELALSNDVDLVYIATPHPFHTEHACLMMEHGKHVLCEKPMALEPSEVEKMTECARRNGVFLMEAMWTRFFPATDKLRQLLAEKVVGRVRHITANFSYAGSYDPTDRVYAPSLAGGALLDLGVYPLMGITMILGWEPETVAGVCEKTPTGVDMRMSVQMSYPDGATAQFFCGMDAVSDDCMTIHGTEGFIEVPSFWHPSKIVLHRVGEVVVYPFAEENEGHHYEFDHAARCIREGLKESPIITLEESLAVNRICTRVRVENGIVYDVPTTP